MKKIILISDTHSFIPEAFWKYLDAADELWHAGDIGNVEVIDSLKKEIKLRGQDINWDGSTPVRC